MIRIVKSIAEVREAVAHQRSQKAIIGLVPTMGALHQGHISLIEACRKQCKFVVVSIYVNPTQFGQAADLSRYPRTLESDQAKCDRAQADLIFHPDDKAMYPAGLQESMTVEPGPLAQILEGAARPGHFKGVATVVLKLLQIVQPHRAYFGQKDFQQQVIIQRMVHEFGLTTEIVVRPIVREDDGVAMSSRNRFLKASDREAAPVLLNALLIAKLAYLKGERDAAKLNALMIEAIGLEPRLKLDYAEVRNAISLASVERAGEHNASVALVAAQVGPVRLIDNALL